jgi:hypothetical protein
MNGSDYFGSFLHIRDNPTGMNHRSLLQILMVLDFPDHLTRTTLEGIQFRNRSGAFSEIRTYILCDVPVFDCARQQNHARTL